MVCGIIAEFNPFHSGHKYLIDYAKTVSDTIVCALSGNFTQRGDTALLSKEKRTEAALKAGADIVVEIPVLWSMSTAQNFALGGIWQLYNMGCDTVLFGSETGNIDAIKNAADVLLSEDFLKEFTKFKKDGVTFASLREKAAFNLGVKKELLKNPNDNLGIEYVMAAKRLGLDIDFICVKRQGVSHSCATPENGFANGEFLRNEFLSGNFESAKRFLPDFYDFSQDDISDIRRIDRALTAILRQKTKQDLKNLPDLSEGLENKIFSVLKEASGFFDICENVKSKRYTLSRIRRLVLSAALGFDNRFFMQPPPYTRVLGANKNGLKRLKNAASLSPVFVKFKPEILSDDCKAVFEAECRATDLYALSFKNPQPCGKEYKRKFIKTEEIL